MDARVITLADRPDRLAAFRARAAIAGMAVDEHIVERTTRAPDRWRASPEAAGNAAAHHAILSAGDGPILIFEDDAVIPPDLPVTLDWALTRLPEDWHMLLLGMNAFSPPDPPRPVRAVERITRFACTHAYAVSAVGRKYLAGCAAHAVGHWDGIASVEMCGRGRTFALWPPHVDQDDSLGGDIPDSWRRQVFDAR